MTPLRKAHTEVLMTDFFPDTTARVEHSKSHTTQVCMCMYFVHTCEATRKGVDLQPLGYAILTLAAASLKKNKHLVQLNVDYKLRSFAHLKRAIHN